MKELKKGQYIFFFFLAVLIAFILGWWVSRITLSPTHSNITNLKQSMASKKPLYWVAPMNPNYRKNQPGKSPMGMDLVPVYNKPGSDGVITISPVIENNLGVRTTKVKKQQFHQQIHTVGYVQPNAQTLQTISVYTEGWIKDLKVSTSGETVKKNQLLFKLYSPILLSAQEEFLLALKHHNSLLINAGIKKLITLGMSERDIDFLKKTRKTQQNVAIYAPQSGYVNKLDIIDGAHVMPTTSLMTIVDPSIVWVIADVYEKQASLLKVGHSVQARFNSLPNQVLQGRIDYIYPELNARSRTVQARLVFANPKFELKPDMYANITIDAGYSQEVLAIPKEAVIQLGTTNRVVLALGEGRFKPVTVTIGQQYKDLVAVTQGLTEGEKVVTSAQFLLDSESNLRAGLSRLGFEDMSDQPKHNSKVDTKTHQSSDSNMDMSEMHHSHAGH